MTIQYSGVNLAGLEFNGGIGGTLWTDYVANGAASYNYWAEAGANTIRLPFSWERLQPTANGPLDADYLQLLREAVANAAANGQTLILDLHNYAAYYGQAATTGTPAEIAAFSNVWTQLAEEFKDSSNVWFGLMNEPHDIDAASWMRLVQAATNAIRATGADNKLLVSTIHWSSAEAFNDPDYADALAAYESFLDPKGNFAFEVHQYLDATRSGSSPDAVKGLGAIVLKGVTEWARDHGYDIFVGEFGVSATGANASEYTKFLKYMADNADVFLGWTAWGAGEWWPSDYRYYLGPAETSGTKFLDAFFDGADGVIGNGVSALTLSLGQADFYTRLDLDFAASARVTVALTAAEALALTRAHGAALHAAGVDTISVKLAASVVKAFSTAQIAALGAAGIDVVDIATNKLVLSAAQIAAFQKAGIDFGSNDTVTQHKAPALIGDVATLRHDATARVSVLANDKAYDGLKLQLKSAVVTSGKGTVTINKDGTLSVHATGTDDGHTPSKVTISYTATDGIETSTASLVVTFQPVAKPLPSLTGTAHGDTIRGTPGNDTIKGLGGNDVLHGLDGNDRLIGGAGNDRIYGGSGKDTIFVSAGDGNDHIDGGAEIDLLVLNRFDATGPVTLSIAQPDTVQTLSDGTRIVHIERLDYQGGNTVTDKITGGAWADTIHGNGGNDVLMGGGGNDKLYGGAGNDILNGGAGNDRIEGGAGIDYLFGGTGQDVFVFKSVSALGTNPFSTDLIFDFSHKDGDRLDFSAIDANTTLAGHQSFTFIGTDSFSKTAGEIRVEHYGFGYLVQGDVNGDGRSDFVLVLNADSKLVASDFLL